ncbi:DUF4158 domain-containing protein [Mesorhizobium sp. M9A.F.Ca.ET.002.03.1.2]|nr:DUF4158 domain-containing protein [Mesorhizobium sp. M9A.F.Ca.ET.002.03.1.2]
MIPEVALAFDQLGLEPDVLTNFTRRSPTRCEQLAVLRQTYGFKDLTHPDREDLLGWARGLVDGTKANDWISAEARDFLAEKLNTPLQIAEHLNISCSAARSSPIPRSGAIFRGSVTAIDPC